METQVGDGMLEFHPYFDIRQKKFFGIHFC